MVFATKSDYSIVCDKDTQSICSSSKFGFQGLHAIPIKGFQEYKNVFSVYRATDGMPNNNLLAQKLMHPSSETPYKHFLDRLNAIFVGASCIANA